MSIQHAIKKFQENVQLLTPAIRQTPPPMNETLLWNLNSGLISLTEALSSQLTHLEEQIRALESRLK